MSLNALKLCQTKSIETNLMQIVDLFIDAIIF